MGKPIDTAAALAFVLAEGRATLADVVGAMKKRPHGDLARQLGDAMKDCLADDDATAAGLAFWESTADAIFARTRLSLDVYLSRKGARAAAGRRLLTIAAAAEYTSLSERTITSLVAEGQIPSAKIAGRRLIERADLDRYIDTAKGGQPID